MALAVPRKFEEIEPQEPIAAQLFQRLRTRIIQLDFKPGQALSETEVARRYAVSRQPVREAFIKLAAAGLVEVRPQRGTFVKKIEVEAVMDARFVREAIEAEVVRAAVTSVDAAAIVGLRAQIAHQRAIPEGDHAGFLAADETFHRTLAEIAGKAYAWRVVEEVKAQMDRVRYLSFGGATSTTVLIDQHERVVDALEARDRKLAEAAIRLHLREILKSLPQIAAAHPDLFDAQP
jgi:DNA-binding GntR family transcriptional regulator